MMLEMKTVLLHGEVKHTKKMHDHVTVFNSTQAYTLIKYLKFHLLSSLMDLCGKCRQRNVPIRI